MAQTLSQDLKWSFLTCVVGIIVGCSKPPVLVTSPGGVTYYVDSDKGEDVFSGTDPTHAWRTLGRVNRTIFGAGDKILFKAGGRFRGQLAPHGSGKEGAGIIVDSYGEGAKPLIQAEGSYPEALLLKNQEYWEVNNLELTNTGWIHWKYRYGVRLQAIDYGTVHHIVLRNLFVHDVNGWLVKGRGEGHGILWENGGKVLPSRFDGLLIENCRLLRTDRNGICGSSGNETRNNWFPSLNVIIRGNDLEDIGGDGIKPFGCDGALVEHNRVYRAGQRCPDYSAGIWPWSCDRTIIQYNEVSFFHGTRDGQAFDSDGNCRDTVFQYNYSHDNDGGFLMMCDDGAWGAPESLGNRGTVVRYNISQNDCSRIFHLTGPITGARIYNNVIFLGKELHQPLFLFTDYHGFPDGIYVANNIFYVEGKCRYSQGTSRHWNGTYEDVPGWGNSKNIRFEANSYFGNHANPPEDARAVRNDPLMLHPGSGGAGFSTLVGYQLREGSPCLRAGVPVSDGPRQDFWGHPAPLGAAPNIGADQR